MLLSILGPVIGVAVLVVVISVMNGFHEKFRKKIFGLTSHLRMNNGGEPIEKPGELIARLEEMGFKATPVIQGHVLVQARRRASPIPLIGIDNKTDPLVTEIKNNCLAEYLSNKNEIIDIADAYDNLQDEEVLVGDGLMRKMGLRIGDKLVVHPTGQLENYVEFREDGSVRVKEPDQKYLPEQLTIAGVFSFGMHQFDSGIIITTLDKASELMTIRRGDELINMDWGQATEIKIKTDDPFKFDIYMKQIKEDPLLQWYHTLSWRQDSLGFFDALQTEKVVMFILLVLIVVVSAFCVCATLITVVFQKTREIGIIKAIGGTPLTVMTIFVIQGAAIGFVGIGGGILLGLGMVAMRNEFLAFMSKCLGRNLLPPALYFFDGLPAEVRAVDLGTVGVSAFALCVLAAVLPALMATFISPSRAIRSE